MNSLPLRSFYVFTTLTALLVGYGIRLGFVAKTNALRAAEEQATASQKELWAQEDAQHAAALRDQAAAAALEHQQAIQRALGGPLDAIAKKPGLGIQEMLRQYALALAPPGSEVSVTVDRFTEFDVALNFPPGGVLLDELSGMAQSLLAVGTPFVHHLRFVHGGRLLGELNYSDLASVTNSGAAGRDAIQKLLQASDTSLAPVETDVAETPAIAPEDQLNPVQTKIEKARRLFNEHTANWTKQLNATITGLNLAEQLGGIKSSAEFRNQMSALDHLEADLARERQFFLDEPADYEQTLNQQSDLDPLLVTILKRQIAARIQPEVPIYEQIFAALAPYLQQERIYLQRMDDLRGQWSTSDLEGTIQFTSAAAKQTYLEESAKVRDRATAVEKALRALEKTVKEKGGSP